MIRQVPTIEQVAFCKEYLSIHSLGQRGVFDGDYFKQLFGFQAETMIKDYLGCERPSGDSGFDGGFDFEYNGLKWDVKCVVRTVKPKVSFACNLTEKQTSYDVDGYIFVSYDSSTGDFWLLGWISKKDFLDLAVYREKGSPILRSDGSKLFVHESFFELPIKKLNRFNVLDDLRGIGL